MDDNLNIQWTDGHQSSFPSSWLKEFCFSKESRKKKKESQSPILWTNLSLKDIPSIPFNDITQSEHSLFIWLNHLQNEGLCLVTNSGVEETTVVCFYDMSIGF